MLGYIILRDIPKDAVQLDLSIYEIQGGFRGFALIPPGVHYVSVQLDGKMHEGFWCYLPPSGVVVQMYDYEQNMFTTDTPENEEYYRELAMSGAMNHALIPVMRRNAEMANLWGKLVSQISSDYFPPTLHSETPMNPPDNLSKDEMELWFLNKHKSRFEQALYDTHNGNGDALLAEFQFAFIRALINPVDNDAQDRWRYLLQAFSHAGERNIESLPELFPPLIDTLIAQLQCLPAAWITSSDSLVSQTKYLAEDLIDTGIKGVAEKGQEFSSFLESKGF
jgi:hypothetical protein